MDQRPGTEWIAACAHRLHRHWRTVDPLELEAVATDISRDQRLRAMRPSEAATEWLKPVESAHVHSLHPAGGC
ncbi:hypothetical protein [Variovorax sp. UMC13]|uniref:hypothetical protein n=1 Tax=Variovorax sp. UMC13 TaxID=1862326 RepID=UPI0016030683|nr:hypothetical protein [Variovorax sp. UMC13]